MQKILLFALVIGLVCSVALSIPLPDAEEKKDDAENAVAETESTEPEAESDEGSADEDAGSGKKDEVPDAADSIQASDSESSSSGEGSTDQDSSEEESEGSAESADTETAKETNTETTKESNKISPGTVKNITNILSKSKESTSPSGAELIEASAPVEGNAEKKEGIEKGDEEGDENKESEGSESEVGVVASKKATVAKKSKKDECVRGPHSHSHKRRCGYNDEEEDHHSGHQGGDNYHHEHEHEHGEHEHQHMHHHHGHHHGFVHEWGQEEGGEQDEHEGHHAQEHEHDHHEENEHHNEDHGGGYGGCGGEGFHGGCGGVGGGGRLGGGYGGSVENLGGGWSGGHGTGCSGHEGGNHGGGRGCNDNYGGGEAGFGGYSNGGCDKKCRLRKAHSRRRSMTAKRFFNDATAFVPLQTMAYHCRDMIINTRNGPVVSRRNCVPIGVARRRLTWDKHQFMQPRVPVRRSYIGDTFKRHTADARSGGFNSAASGYGMATPYGHPVTHPGFTTMGFPGHAVSTTDVKESIPHLKAKRQTYEGQQIVQNAYPQQQTESQTGESAPEEHGQVELQPGGPAVEQPNSMREVQQLANHGAASENQLNALLGGANLPGEQSNFGIAQQINAGKYPGIPSGIQGIPGIPGIINQGFADGPAVTPSRPDFMSGQPMGRAVGMGMPNGKWQ